MLCNIKPVPFHESDKHIFAKIPGGGGVRTPGPPSGSAHARILLTLQKVVLTCRGNIIYIGICHDLAVEINLY